MRLTCVLACFIAALNCSAQSTDPAQPQGRIVGVVVNDLNEPVADADLCTSIVRTNASNSSCGSQQADAHGHFDIRVPLNTNRVFAQNPKAGYQQPTRPMDQGVRVTLTELNSVAHVTIKIGPRPAEIDLTVTDKATGKPVDSFLVRWARLDDGLIMFVNSTNHRVFVPPDVDVLLTIQAHGYERWFYTDVNKPSHPVFRLSSGEEKRIDAELEPH